MKTQALFHHINKDIIPEQPPATLHTFPQPTFFFFFGNISLFDLSPTQR